MRERRVWLVCLTGLLVSVGGVARAASRTPSVPPRERAFGNDPQNPAGGLAAASTSGEGAEAASGFGMGGEGGTFRAKLRGDGFVLVTTGTGDGECVEQGGAILCTDGESSAAADLDRGCLGFTGAGSCAVAPEIEAFDVDRGVAVAVGSRQAVATVAGNFLCGTGRLSGRKFTMSDVDGSGCTAQFTGTKVSGATCTHNNHECAAMSCDHGCTHFRDGCKCEMSDDARVPDAAQ